MILRASQKYSLDFKKKAIDLCKNGKSISAVSRETKIPYATLIKWITKHGQENKEALAVKVVPVKKTENPVVKTVENKCFTSKNDPVFQTIKTTLEEREFGELCARCGDRGHDRRTLFMKCFYKMQEFKVPFVEVKFPSHKSEEWDNFYTLRVCKNCRGSWLKSIEKWFINKEEC